MGLICSSCESACVATAKLILDDGRLQEFSYPAKVSYILQNNPVSFVCNSEDMDFDGVVSAVSDEEELQVGQLYFLLPLSLLKHRLKAEEMAALAVKASSALSNCRDKGSRQVFSGDYGEKMLSKMVDGGIIGESGSRRRRMGVDAGRRMTVTARLSAIPE